MKVLIVLILFSSLSSFSQEVNPWESIGKEAPKTLSLTNGQYPEIFENDSLRKIGNIIFNIHTKQIVGFIEADTLYSEATLEPEIVSRWLSTDPLAAKYPSHSPYNFVGNMPVIAIDPDGRYIYIVVGTKENGEKVKIRYIPGMRSEGLGEFAKNSIEGLNYIHQYAPEKIRNLARSKHSLNLLEENSFKAGSGYQANYGRETDLFWNDNESFTTTTSNTTSLSPIEILAHEVDHSHEFIMLSDKAYNSTNDDDDIAWTQMTRWTEEDWIENVEEMRAINGLEKLIRTSLGKNNIRTSHTGLDKVGYTDNIFSSEYKLAPTTDIRDKIHNTNNRSSSKPHFLEKEKTIPMVEAAQ